MLITQNGFEDLTNEIFLPEYYEMLTRGLTETDILRKLHEGMRVAQEFVYSNVFEEMHENCPGVASSLAEKFGRVAPEESPFEHQQRPPDNIQTEATRSSIPRSAFTDEEHLRTGREEFPSSYYTEAYPPRLDDRNDDN